MGVRALVMDTTMLQQYVELYFTPPVVCMSEVTSEQSKRQQKCTRQVATSDARGTRRQVGPTRFSARRHQSLAPRCAAQGGARLCSSCRTDHAGAVWSMIAAYLVQKIYVLD